MTVLGLGMGAVSGCASNRPVVTPEEGVAIAEACMEAVGAPGTYSIAPGQASVNGRARLPRAFPVEALGGTQAGADGINGCVEARILGGRSAASAGSTVGQSGVHSSAPPISSTLCPADFRGLYRGTLICGTGD